MVALRYVNENLEIGIKEFKFNLKIWLFGIKKKSKVKLAKVY